MHRKPHHLTTLALVCNLSLFTGAFTRAQDWSRKESREDFVLICQGRLEEALESLKGCLEKDPRNGEALFCLAVAHAHRGATDAALGFVEKALEAGLPFERFAAGPRDVLAPLTSTDAFRKLAAEHPVKLLHGPLLGSVTDSSARFWVRTAREMPVRVRVRPRNGGGAETLESPVVETRPDRELTAVAEVRGLKPDTRYTYRLVLDGEEEGRSFSFRTFPRTGDTGRFHVAFGGGAAYTPSCERMFTTIAARQPLSFLQLGDNVYIDRPKMPAVQQYCYYRRQSSPPYRMLAASTCVAAIYDDHDFGTNDCWAGSDVDDPPWKRAVWKVFRNNWNNPSYGGGDAQPGCYFDFRIGDVHFLLLDCRYYRTSPRAEDRSMLGAAQKRWLFERLKSSRGTFKVLASSVPFASGVKPGSLDPWDGYPEEREEIFSFIEKNRIEGVILISADRHRSDAWRIPRPGAYDLYEFESSRLTNVHTHGVMKGCLFGYNKDRSFGLLSFDTTLEDPTVRYTIVTIDNEPVHEMTLKRSQLGFGKAD